MTSVQSKRGSILEAGTNLFLGSAVYFPVNLFVLPYFVEGIAEYSILTALGITLTYTAVAATRLYLVRRVFNRWTGRKRWL